MKKYNKFTIFLAILAISTIGFADDKIFKSEIKPKKKINKINIIKLIFIFKK